MRIERDGTNRLKVFLSNGKAIFDVTSDKQNIDDYEQQFQAIAADYDAQSKYSGRSQVNNTHTAKVLNMPSEKREQPLSQPDYEQAYAALNEQTQEQKEFEQLIRNSLKQYDMPRDAGAGMYVDDDDEIVTDVEPLELPDYSSYYGRA